MDKESPFIRTFYFVPVGQSLENWQQSRPSPTAAEENTHTRSAQKEGNESEKRRGEIFVSSSVALCVREQCTVSCKFDFFGMFLIIKR